MMINDLKLFHSALFQLSEVLPIPTSRAGNNASTAAKRTSRSDADLALLDKLVNTLLERKATESSSSSPSQSQSSTLQRLRPLSSSLSRSFRMGSLKRNNNSALPTIAEGGSGRRSGHAMNPGVKNVINTIKNAPHRFSTANEEESKNLTQNILE